jgi:hypothetical protein
MKPAAQGTKHCHRKTRRFPVLKLKVIVLWASAKVQGATLHWFFALSAIPLSGTLTPSSGIANVCDARSVQDRDRLAVHGGLADDPERSPRMDCRRPVAVSHW